MTQPAAATVSNPFVNQPAPKASAGGMVEVEQQRAIAEAQSAMVIAKRFPRDPVAAMDRILNACARPALAAGALYTYNKGGTDVSGPSIRLTEELARNWGNLRCGVMELSRANGVSECLAYAVDLETNFGDEKRFQVKHWRDTKKGGYVITEEREIYELIANMGARRKRACMLAVIPGDVAEAAVRQCEITLRTTADTSPEAIAKMIETFSTEFGVTREMIEARIQRRLDTIQPAQMVQMKKIYASLRDGMSSPADWFDDAGDKVVQLKSGKAERPPLTDEGFAEKLKEWAPVIASGKKTPAQVITAAETKNALTPDQKNAIDALKLQQENSDANA